MDAVPQERDAAADGRGAGSASLVLAVVAWRWSVAAGVGLFLRAGSGPGVRRGADVDRRALSRARASCRGRPGEVDRDPAGPLRRTRRTRESWATLGFAYVQEARVTADPSYYPKAEGALRRSLTLSRRATPTPTPGWGPWPRPATTSPARCPGASRPGDQPVQRNVHAIIGDALVELGRYPQAFARVPAHGRHQARRRDYARASYARELQGASRRRMHSMRLAYQAAGTPADAAWASY